MPKSSDSQGQGFGIDMGPMITAWILMWLVNRIDNYAAKFMGDGMNARDKTTWSSKSINRSSTSNDNSQNNPEFIFPDETSNPNQFRRNQDDRGSLWGLNEDEFTEEELQFLRS